MKWNLRGATGVLLVLFLLASCSEPEIVAEDISFGRDHSVQASSQNLEGLELDNDGLWRGTLPFQPLVEISSLYTVIGGVEANLDRDANPEQAVIVSDSGDGNSLHLFVIDFDFTTRQPSIVYRSRLAVEVVSSLTVKAEDLLGDSENELLIEGFTKSGDSTLQIFKATSSSAGGYTLVFDKTLRGTMNVLRSQRSQTYERGMGRGVPFSISVQYEILQSSGILQEYNETYEYSPTFREYRLMKREEAAQNLNRQFLSFLQRGKKGVMELLSGPWYKTESRQGTSFFFFDDKNERIQFYNRRRQEVFIWDYSSLPSLQTFYVTAHNELVEMIKNNFRIHILDMNRIEISSDADETMDLSGVFHRMSDSVQETVFVTAATGVPQRQMVTYPSGLYVGERDIRLEFQYPRLTWRQGESVKEGIFDSFFFKGQEILQWEFREADGSIMTESFSLTYRENDQDPNGKRSLVLKPISLLFNRIYASDGPLSLRFDPFTSEG